MRLFFTILCSVFYLISFGQVVKLNGQIIDEDKESLPFANIKNVNTAEGTQSDIDGYFELLCTKGDSIEFSYIGKAPQTIIAKDSSFLKVILKSDGLSHWDGYKEENIHNFQLLTNPKFDDFIVDYRFSFEHYNKKEIGRMPIHAVINHLDFGFSYLRFEEDYLSFYAQINNFFKFKRGKFRRITEYLLSPYVNIGMTAAHDDLVPHLRLDVGTSIMSIRYKHYISISLDFQWMTQNSGDKYFFGITLSKPKGRYTGGYD